MLNLLFAFLFVIFEYLNYNPATIIVDEPYTYKNGMSIKNYDNGYLGPITIRKALSDSRNIPAVKLFNEVGYEKAFDFVRYDDNTFSCRVTLTHILYRRGMDNYVDPIDITFYAHETDGKVLIYDMDSN